MLNSIPNNQILTVKEAAEYLKINPQVMERYLRRGEVPARKVGKQWRISKLALDLWLAPSLANFLPRLSNWQDIFSIGNAIGKEVDLSDDDILKSVRKLRKDRGIFLKSRS